MLLSIFWINDDVEVPENSRLRIVFDGLIGEKYVDIQPNVESTVMVKHGAVLNGIATLGLADFVDIAAKNLLETKAIVESIRKVVTDEDVTSTVKNMILDFGRIAENVSQLMEVSNEVSVKAIGDSISTITSDLARITTSLKHLSSEMEDKEVVEKIDDILANIVQFTAAFSGGGGEGDAGLVSGLRKVGETLASLRLRTTAGVRYFVPDKNPAFIGDFDLMVGSKYLRIGFGNRFGPVQLLHLQYGLSMTDYLVGRVGIINNEPGFGLDYHLFPILGFSVSAYNFKSPVVDVQGNLRLSDELKLTAGMTKNPVTGDYDYYSFGFKYTN